MISMKDIAKACNVTVATVSKALNDKDDIGIEMKAKIKEVAKEMGYLPNSAARALKTQKSYMVGVLFVDGTSSGLTHDYFAAMLESIKETVEAKGYDISFVNHHIGAQTMSYLEHCIYRNVDGVIVACVDFETQEVKDLVNSHIPVVTIDHDYGTHDAVMSDNEAGIRELVHYAYSKGHRKIAYIYGQDSQVSNIRYQAFIKTCRQLGIETPKEYLIKGIYNDIENAKRNTQKLLQLKERPTCIFYSDDLTCIGGIYELGENGLSVPDDIAVAGYDGIKSYKIFKPNLTTICQDTVAVGKKAAERLIDLIEKKEIKGNRVEVVSGKLVQGESI